MISNMVVAWHNELWIQRIQDSNMLIQSIPWVAMVIAMVTVKAVDSESCLSVIKDSTTQAVIFMRPSTDIIDKVDMFMVNDA